MQIMEVRGNALVVHFGAAGALLFYYRTPVAIKIGTWGAETTKVWESGVLTTQAINRFFRDWGVESIESRPQEWFDSLEISGPAGANIKEETE